MASVPNSFEKDGKLHVRIGSAIPVNGTIWENKGEIWPSRSRATHKVYRDKRPALIKAKKAALKQQLAAIEAQLEAMAVSAQGFPVVSRELLPINSNFVSTIIENIKENKKNTKNYFGAKLSRGLSAENISDIKEYIKLRESENAGKIAAELTVLHKEGQLKDALKALKNTKKEINMLNSLLSGMAMGVEGGKRKTHRRKTHRRQTRRN